jgi:hypothetical protein
VASKSPRERPYRGFSRDGIPVRRSGPGSSREVGGIFKVSRWSYRWGTASGSPVDSVAGRFAFPASSTTLAVAGRVLEAFPCPPFSVSGGVHLRFASGFTAFTLVIFSSPSERSRLCRNSSRLPKKSEFLLSWDSFACCPFAVWPPPRPLPEARAPFGPMVRPIESCSVLKVFHLLGGFLRVGAAGLLHPATGCGVRCVSRCPSHLLLAMGTNLPFPATRSPFEEFPSPAAVPHHCGRCLLAVSVHPFRSHVAWIPEGTR